MRPLWRDLILQTWGGDPLPCPCCKDTMKPVRKVIRPEEIEFFLRFHSLWEPERSGDRLPGGPPREGWSDSDINASSSFPDRLRHPLKSKNTEGL